MLFLPHVAEINDLPIQKTYCRSGLDEKFVLFGSEQHFFKVMIYVK